MMNKSIAMDRENTEGHCCFFYKNQKDRLKLLASYFKEGIDKNELCVFVTASAEEQVIDDYKKSAPYMVNAIQTKSLLVFEMNGTYMPDGQFVADYMIQNVKQFIEEAEKGGFTGLRTAGEMKWINDNPAESDNAIFYEQQVNTLNEPKPIFVGLCLYPMNNLSEELTDGVLKSHPTIIYQNRIKNNPFYSRT